jgi:hypothetical protein
MYNLYFRELISSLERSIYLISPKYTISTILYFDIDFTNEIVSNYKTSALSVII